MKKSLSYVLVILLVLCQGFAGEEKDPPQKVRIQHHVTVTANRVETSEREVASAITVITRADLERFKRLTVLEALDLIPGLSISQNGPPGSSANLFIRGANSEHTKVMIDGVEINDPISPGRTPDLGILLVESVERIEVLRGPQSTLYGSDAMAGVVNIISRRDRGKIRFDLSSRAGSYGTRAVNAHIGGGGDRWLYSFGGSYLKTDGVSAAGSSYEGNKERDGVRNASFSGHVGYSPAPNISMDFSMRFIRTRLEIDEYGGDFGDDPNKSQDYDAVLWKGEIRGLFLNNRWEQKLSFSAVDYDRRLSNPVDADHPVSSEEAAYFSRIYKVSWQNNLFLSESNTLTLGVEHQVEQGESEYRSMSAFGPFTSDFPFQRAQTSSFYFQDRVRVGGALFGTVGARIDFHSQFGSAVTFRMAPSYLIKPWGTRIKATVGTGFKAPSLYQLYAPPTFYAPVGNEFLKPERAVGWDLGIEQILFDGSLLLGAAYFDNSYQNLILYDYLSGYYNVGRARSRGIEVFFRLRPKEVWMISAEYTRTNAKDRDSGEYLLRRPRDKFTARIQWNPRRGFQLSMNLIYTGKRQDMMWIGWTPAPVTMADFTLLNAAVSYEPIKGLELFLRIDNILDASYELVKGYGTYGRAVYAGFQFRLNGS